MRSTMHKVLVALAILALSLSLCVAHSDDDDRGDRDKRDDDRERMSEALEERAKGVDKVDVIVQFRRGAPAEERSQASEMGQLKRSYARLPMVAMTIPSSRLDKLAEHPAVEFVSLDDEVFGLSQSARLTANTPPIGSYYDYTYNGGGFALAVIDSGVGAHADVPLLLQQDFVAGSALNYAQDPFGHGSHIAGIATGEGGASSYVHWGLAYGAQVVSLRVLDHEGRGEVSAVLAALDWLLLNAATHNVRVANLSLGKGVETAAADDPLVQAVEAVWDAGIVVVVSAGNYGSAGAGTITSPGNSSKVITVGSITDNGTGLDFADDYVSTYSSRGPTRFDNFLKPDLLAPGNRFVAAMASEAQMMVDMPERVTGCSLGLVATCQADYLELSGTSMAAGLVSGSAIRMIDRDPTLTPATVKARLMKSARKVPGDPTVVGAGVLDITAALDATGFAAVAPSPILVPATDGSGMFVQNTAIVWGDATWDMAFLFTDAYLWSDASLFSDAFLHSDASLFSDAFLHSDAYLWSDASLFSDAFVFSDAYLWSDRVTQDDGLFQAGAQSVTIVDDTGSAPLADASSDR